MRRWLLYCWVVAALLAPSSTLLVGIGGCSNGCELDCSPTTFCVTGKCFKGEPDHRGDCASYTNGTVTFDVYDNPVKVTCRETFNASGALASVTCEGVEGKVKRKSCTCKRTYSGGEVGCE